MSWTADVRRRPHRSSKVPHHLLCTSAGLLGILAVPPGLTPHPCCRLARMARHNMEEEAIQTGGITDPAMVHLITTCRPSETMAGIADNRVDRLSRAKVIYRRLHNYLLDFLSALISLDIPTDADQALTDLQ